MSGPTIDAPRADPDGSSGDPQVTGRVHPSVPGGRIVALGVAFVVSLPVVFVLHKALHVLLSSHSNASGPWGFLALTAGTALGSVQMFLPGAGVLCLLGRRAPRGVAARFGVVVGAATVVWWAVFWIEVGNAAWGSRLTWIVLVAGATGVLFTGLPSAGLLRPVAALLGIGVATVCVVCGVLFVHGGLQQATNLGTTAAYGTPDSLFPRVWIDRAEAGQPLDIKAFGWPMIDRPPLQSAMQEPVYRVAGSRDLAYEISGATLEALVISSLALLLVVLGGRGLRLLGGIALLLLTVHMGFSLIFVWPKMLTAALMLLAVAMAVEERPRGWLAWATIGTLVGASVVAHPGGAFALPALAVVLIPPGARRLWRRRSVDLRPEPVPRASPVPAIIAAGLGLALELGTWVLYRIVGDTTPSSLLKWHLGGVTDLSDRRSLTQVLRHDASVLGIRGWLHLKWMNILYTLGDGVPRGASSNLRYLSDIAVFSPMWVCGLVCLLVPFAFLPGWTTEGAVSGRRLIGGGVLASGIWLCLEYGPPNAPPWTHQGPYGAFLLVGVVAVAAFVIHANRWLVMGAVAVQAAFWAQAWWPRGTILNCTGPCVPALQKVVSGYTESTVRPWIALAVVVGLGLFWVASRTLSADYDTARSTLTGSPSTVPAIAVPTSV